MSYNKYTVVGYYEDNGQIWVEYAVAENSSQAVIYAVKALESRNEDCLDRANICIVEVFEGHNPGLTDGDHVSSAIDWPGLEVKDD